MKQLPSGALRAKALSLLAWIAPGGDLDVGMHLGEQALTEAAGDLALEAITRLQLGLLEMIRGNLDESMAHRVVAAELAEHIGDQALTARALSAVGFATALRDCGVAQASRRAVEIERRLPEFLGQYSPSIELGQVLMYAGAVAEARTVLVDAMKRAIAAGDESAHCNCLYRLAVLERRAELGAGARFLRRGPRAERAGRWPAGIRVMPCGRRAARRRDR